MNSQEFNELWNKCIMPSFQQMKNQDSTLYFREDSFDSLCRAYNDIKNSTKRLFMKKDVQVRLDRHKIAACLAKAIVMVKPIGKPIGNEYTGTEEDFFLANEALAFVVALSILRAYIELKLNNEKDGFGVHRKAYERICEEDFVFPDTIMGVEYGVSVCWAWHHNMINGHFDVLGAANLFFMIENYSVATYDIASR